MTHIAAASRPLQNTVIQRQAGVIFVAIIHAADAVLFTATADSRVQLLQQIAQHVRTRANHALSPKHADHVKRLLGADDLESAIMHYFEFVGERWDDETLVTTAIDSAYITALGSGLNSVV